jgi:hypothetical protein
MEAGAADAAVRLGVSPAMGYTDATGQPRIAFSTSLRAQPYTANSGFVFSYSTYTFGCITGTQQLSGYQVSGSFPSPGQIFGKRIPSN